MERRPADTDLTRLAAMSHARDRSSPYHACPMKNQRLFTLTLLLSLLLLSLSLTSRLATAQALIRIGAATGTEAYTPLVKAIYAEMGYQAVISFMPAERSFAVVNAGIDFDAHFGAAAVLLERYPNLVQTREPLAILLAQAWIRKGSPIVIRTPSDLKRHKVGMIRGAKLTEALAAKLQLEVQLANSLDSLARMLAAGRFDVAIVPSSANRAALDEVGTLIAPKLARSEAFHLFHRKRADLVAPWDVIIKAMKADGRYQALLPPQHD
jgi:ABC-type amino acid transport substrate-binding protein